MIVTTIWGTPEPETAWRIPRTPCLSVRRSDGDRIRQLIREGRGRVRLITRVRTGWAPIPHLTAHLDGTAEDRFIMFSGHVDGWHFTAPWTTGRRTPRCSRSPGSWRAGGARSGAGFRLAFWSGHSHGRYAGLDLVRGPRVDGAPPALRGAPEHRLDRGPRRHRLFGGPRDRGRAELRREGRARRDGPDAAGAPLPRAGDQSFWGIGIPSALMSLSGIPKRDTDLSRWMERLFGTAGFPWWWHTREDTIDKIDADVLALDTRVYVAAALRPRRRAGAAARLRAVRARDRRDGGGAQLRPDGWDAAPALEAARHLAERAARFTGPWRTRPPGRGDAAQRGGRQPRAGRACPGS